MPALTIDLPEGLYVIANEDGGLEIWQDNAACWHRPIAVANDLETQDGVWRAVAVGLAAAGHTGTCACGHPRGEHTVDPRGTGCQHDEAPIHEAPDLCTCTEFTPVPLDVPEG